MFGPINPRHLRKHAVASLGVSFHSLMRLKRGFKGQGKKDVARSYSYSTALSDTDSVRWINRVNIATIRFKLTFPTRFASESIA